MGRARRQTTDRTTDDEQRYPRLPCGCDPRELAEAMGMPLDELLRAAENAEHPDDADGPVLLTFPNPPPFDDAHLGN